MLKTYKVEGKRPGSIADLVNLLYFLQALGIKSATHSVQYYWDPNANGGQGEEMANMIQLTLI